MITCSKNKKNYFLIFICTRVRRTTRKDNALTKTLNVLSVNRAENIMKLIREEKFVNFLKAYNEKYIKKASKHGVQYFTIKAYFNVTVKPKYDTLDGRWPRFFFLYIIQLQKSFFFN